MYLDALLVAAAHLLMLTSSGEFSHHPSSLPLGKTSSKIL